MPTRRQPMSEQEGYEPIKRAIGKLDPEGTKGWRLGDVIAHATKAETVKRETSAQDKAKGRETRYLEPHTPQRVKEIISQAIDNGHIRAVIRPTKTAPGAKQPQSSSEIRYFVNEKTEQANGYNPLRQQTTDGKIDNSHAYKPLERRQLSPLFHGETRLPLFIEMVRKSLANRTDSHSKRAFDLATGILRGTALSKMTPVDETAKAILENTTSKQPASRNTGHGKYDPFTALGKELKDLGHPMADSLNWKNISRSFTMDRLVHSFLAGSFEKSRGKRNDFDFYKDIFQGFARDKTHEEHKKNGATNWRRADEVSRKQFWDRMTSFLKTNAKQFGLDPEHMTETAIEKSMGRAVLKAFMKDRAEKGAWAPGNPGRVPNYARELPAKGSPERYRKIRGMVLRLARITKKTGIFSADPASTSHATNYAMERKNFKEAMSLTGAPESNPHYETLVDGEFDRAKGFFNDYPYHPASIRYVQVYGQKHPNHFKVEAAANLLGAARSNHGKSPDWLGSGPADPHSDFIDYVLSHQSGGEVKHDPEVMHDYIEKERLRGTPRHEIVQNITDAGVHPQTADALYETNLDRERVPYNLDRLKKEYGAVKNQNDQRTLAIKLLNEGQDEESAVRVMRLLDKTLDDFDAKQVFRMQESLRTIKDDLGTEARFGTGVERLVEMASEKYGLTPENAFKVVRTLDRPAASKPTGKAVPKKDVGTFQNRKDPRAFVLDRLGNQPDEVIAKNLSSLYGVPKPESFVSRVKKEKEHQKKMQDKLVDNALFLRHDGQYNDSEIVDSLIKKGVSDQDAIDIVNLADNRDAVNTGFEVEEPNQHKE